MRSLALIGLVLSSCAVSQTPDPAPVDGRISGRVVNEDGKPVPGATGREMEILQQPRAVPA
jgi:hypothetical protein